MSVSDPQPVPKGPPPGDVGALLIGMALGGVSCGVVMQQTVFYLGHFPQDGMSLRLWVVCMWVLVMVTTVLDTHTVYNYFVTHYGEATYAAFEDWGVNASSAVTGTVILLVQSFFIVRIRRLRKTVYPTSRLTDPMVGFFIILALFAFGTTLQSTYYDFRQPHARIRRPIYISNVTVGILLDFLITITMVEILHYHRREFPVKRNPLVQLVLFFITRGIILTLFQTFLVILAYAIPANFTNFGIYACLSKVYVLSALVTLNNRERLRRRREMLTGYQHSSIPIPELNLTAIATDDMRLSASSRQLRRQYSEESIEPMELEMKGTSHPETSSSDPTHSNTTLDV
ncbi:hypothetical protein FA95DRAFT_624191 [Auriscalpium vulgare]|uniref:Uncharacterized protein n=1 Tax=Auriscalpium vulgare TaxID=40419 RepID=A0ACB8S2R3_9AGAM|nr:hypothetical protein FA95DRAFT_624191 [Auriscalpium vulgare]